MVRATLKGTVGKIIPDGWEEHISPVVDTAFTADIVITAEPDVEYDEVLMIEVPLDEGELRWQGKARVQQKNVTEKYVMVSGQRVAIREYLVAVPEAVDNVDIGDVVKVVNSKDGAQSELRVVSVLKGSLRWERDLMCLDSMEWSLWKSHMATGL